MGSKRWIMVSDGTPQFMYAGKTALEEEELDERMASGKAVELTDCRAMRTLIMPGQNGSITQSEILTPVCLARSGIRLKLRITAYFWPDEDKATEHSFMDKLKNVETAEIKHKAAEAGLVTVNVNPMGGGKVLS